jgi:methionyl-tRNA formyltransferase
MKIVLLGHEDIASLIALDTLVREVPGHDYTIFVSGPMKPRGQPAPTLDRLDAIDRALYDRYRPETVRPELFDAARALPAPNGPDGVRLLRHEAPDLIVSIRYRRILRDEAIAVPTHGVLNLHSGILPDYRGVMATFWAMLAGEAEIGTTLHRIVDAGIDTGPVIAISRQAADYSASYLANVISLYRDGCRAIVDAIADIDQGGRIEVREQPAGEGRYFGPPSESDAVAFEQRGLTLADGRELTTCRTLVRT